MLQVFTILNVNGRINVRTSDKAYNQPQLLSLARAASESQSDGKIMQYATFNYRY